MARSWHNTRRITIFVVMKALHYIFSVGLILLPLCLGAQEPVCKNKRTDKYIRSYFFESDGTTLDVVYYKGKTTFKNKISLASQSIRHMK